MEVRATTGAVLGPPWQQAENGYIVRPVSVEEEGKGKTDILVLISLYYGFRAGGGGLTAFHPLPACCVLSGLNGSMDV